LRHNRELEARASGNRSTDEDTRPGPVVGGCPASTYGPYDLDSLLAAVEVEIAGATGTDL